MRCSITSFTRFLVIFSFVLPAQALENDWLTPTGGDFLDPLNWSLGVVPGFGVDAVFDLSSAGYTVYLDADLILGSLNVFDDAVTLDLGTHALTVTSSNLLPIPVLDGGHLFYYAIEAITRRPLPEKSAGDGLATGHSRYRRHHVHCVLQ